MHRRTAPAHVQVFCQQRKTQPASEPISKVAPATTHALWAQQPQAFPYCGFTHRCYQTNVACWRMQASPWQDHITFALAAPCMSSFQISQMPCCTSNLLPAGAALRCLPAISPMLLPLHQRCVLTPIETNLRPSSLDHLVRLQEATRLHVGRH